MENKEQGNIDWGAPEEELTNKYSSAPLTINKDNKHVYLSAVFFLGLATLFSIIGSILIACLGKPIPSAIVAIGSVAVGALGALFTKTS